MKSAICFSVLISTLVTLSSSFASQELVSQGFRQLSRDYYSGSHLVYDCWSRHWACVDDYSFLRCGEKRKVSEEDFESILACMPFKKFKNEKLCVKKQQQLIITPQSYDFCLHPINRI